MPKQIKKHEWKKSASKSGDLLSVIAGFVSFSVQTERGQILATKQLNSYLSGVLFTLQEKEKKS